MNLPRILAITDRTQARCPLDVATRQIAESGGWLLFRDKDMDPAERRALAVELRAITARLDTPLSISADIDLAAEIAADGVHLQRTEDIEKARSILGADAWTGVSAHSLGDVARARDSGANYVTLSPIFASDSKPGYGPALGVATIERAALLGIPVYALGGVTPAFAAGCVSAGAHGIAVMGGLMRAVNPAAALREYEDALG